MLITSPPVSAAVNMISGAMLQMGQTFALYDISESVSSGAFPCIIVTPWEGMDWGFNTLTGSLRFDVVDIHDRTQEIEQTIAEHSNLVFTLVNTLHNLPLNSGYLITPKFRLGDPPQIDGETFQNGTGLVVATFYIDFGLQE